MRNTTTGFEKIEEDILAFEVSDDALEIAAGTSAARNTRPSFLARKLNLG